MHGETDPLGADDAARGGAVLLDVREPDEFSAGHAPGATSVPVGELAQRLGELPRDRRIVCVCRVGARSATAADLLTAAGFDAVNLAGGMVAWAADGLPVQSAAGGVGAVV